MCAMHCQISFLGVWLGPEKHLGLCALFVPLPTIGAVAQNRTVHARKQDALCEPVLKYRDTQQFHYTSTTSTPKSALHALLQPPNSAETYRLASSAGMLTQAHVAMRFAMYARMPTVRNAMILAIILTGRLARRPPSYVPIRRQKNKLLTLQRVIVLVSICK